MSAATRLLWFRNDRRLDDNPALAAACAEGAAVVPVFIWSPEAELEWAPGGASRWWIHHSLAALGASLDAAGSRLILRRGEPGDVLAELAESTGAGEVHWNAHHEPHARETEREVASRLEALGVASHAHQGSLLVSPSDVKTGSGTPYKVFTPFWKAIQALGSVPDPIDAPSSLTAPERWPQSAPLDSLDLLPAVDWAGGMREAWTPGEAGAAETLEAFVENALADYGEGRDRPGVRSTSRLSPFLHHGEIGVRRLWHGVERRAGSGPYLRQVAWREFAHHLLHHFPTTTNQPLRPEWTEFRWEGKKEHLRRWQRGRTGYPIVDAGMRELWTTGWMHNRVRLIAGSFLVKDLLVHWLEGARWFWDTLVDADLASNTLGWQWIAGSGADAAPYFRVFNPVTQGKRFDPEGEYVRRWVPELERLPAAVIHEPWRAGALELSSAGVTLGEDYPEPIVDHADARERALAAYAELTES